MPTRAESPVKRPEAGDDAPVLQIDSVNTTFQTRFGPVEVVNDASLTVHAGESVAVVGESGSGKSVTALSVMGLLENTGEVTHGSIRLRGRELVGLPKRAYRAVRGRNVGMIFQDPTTCLDPVYTIGYQIVQAIRVHTDSGRRAARERAIELLTMVGIPDSASRMSAYPHELSGGQRQRVMIAIALACGPDLLIADEPTTALDVTVQAQILDLLQQTRRELGTALLLITHDLAVVSEVAERVVVMYAGQVVEQGPVADVLTAPQHPYTAALLRSVPPAVTDRSAKLHVIEGTVPSPHTMPSGCRFAPRCAHVMDHCATDQPPLFEVPGEREQQSRCWLADSDQHPASSAPEAHAATEVPR
ncbi:oligopeptide/dipeptide ABC transporter ATP-binding protein [Lipingzhangella halophila]|uniref:Oligopeptide/dipeptide ABC transporter ATP-binding protein n=1 Tax=Lipingzhangella halophila TaxID=1783352 RepID=A0A7W7W1A4_9ACTN|nr:ABC transporter ATP-binding protein [Lipingzhangella halophila]MBB4930436.1 oligopeptide/dipeptide ABC transporter ATP-binding protein [Lipingzhangella halophila]